MMRDLKMLTMRTLKISSLRAQDIFSRFRTLIFQLCKGFTIASARAIFVAILVVLPLSVSAAGGASQDKALLAAWR